MDSAWAALMLSVGRPTSVMKHVARPESLNYVIKLAPVPLEPDQPVYRLSGQWWNPRTAELAVVFYELVDGYTTIYVDSIGDYISVSEKNQAV